MSSPTSPCIQQVTIVQENVDEGEVDEMNENPTWKTLDSEHNVNNTTNTCPLQRALVYMESPNSTLSSTLSQIGLSLTSSHHPKSSKPLLTIQYDAVVVGSGSGSGVAAGLLARARYKVVVTEKGDCNARKNLSLLEGQAMDKIYESYGFLTTDDTSVLILAGSTIGGGSAVNWAAFLRTPEHVISEWRNEHGIELFGSAAYYQALYAVCGRFGVQNNVDDDNLNNSVLRRGCKELGYLIKNISRNSPPDHYCGWCCFGCKDGRKKGTYEMWLVDMLDSGNGVILQVFHLDESSTLHEDIRAISSGQRKMFHFKIFVHGIVPKQMYKENNNANYEVIIHNFVLFKKRFVTPPPPKPSWHKLCEAVSLAMQTLPPKSPWHDHC